MFGRYEKNTLAAGLVGVIVALLGLLWFLQGTGILLLCPVLCFVDCECVMAGSPFWEAVGAIAFIIGIVIVGVSVRRLRATGEPDSGGSNGAHTFLSSKS